MVYWHCHRTANGDPTSLLLQRKSVAVFAWRIDTENYKNVTYLFHKKSEMKSSTNNTQGLEK